MKLMRAIRIKSWLQSYRSFNVRSNKGYALEAILRKHDLTVDELLRMPDDEVCEVVESTVRAFAKEGKGAFARNILDTVRSLFLYHDRDIRIGRFAHLRTGKRIGEQIIPKPSDIYKMAEVAGTFSLRNKALILCLFQSGVRTRCVTRWTYGSVKDSLYPDLRLPVRLRVTSKMDTKLPSYGLNYYITFLGREVAEALRNYIEQRKQDGWEPADSDIIFVTAGTTPESRGRPLAISHIDEMIKRIAKRSGLDSKGIWPYCLRKSFRKVINNAPIDEDTKEALMGHTLPNSRTNYFDYHDVDNISRKYELAAFSMDTGSQFDVLLMRMDGVEARLMAEIDDLKKQIHIMRSDRNTFPAR